jgi:hypothetical protein
VLAVNFPTQEDKDIFGKKLQDFLFLVLPEIYAIGRKPKTLNALPESKTYDSFSGDFACTLLYFTQGKKFFGMILVYYRGVLVWSMRFEGWQQDNSVTEFLQVVLRDTYQNRIFAACRGVTTKGTEMIYENHYHKSSTIFGFSGTEYIFKGPGAYGRLYQCDYSGGM